MARIINGSRVVRTVQHFGVEIIAGAFIHCEDEEDALAYQRIFGGNVQIREEMFTEDGGAYETDWADL